MKFLIRDLKNGNFYRSPGVWVAATNLAVRIGSKEEALRIMEGQDLSNFELLGLLPDGTPSIGFNMSGLT